MRKIILILAFLSVISLSAFSQSFVFFDDFESGTNQWIFTGSWGFSTDFSYSLSHSLTDSPGGYYPSSATSYATMANGVDLTGYLSASLTFRTIFDLEPGFDFVYVQVSDDDFLTFTDLDAFTGLGFGADSIIWEEKIYPLGAFLGKTNVKVRFKIVSDNYLEYDGFYLDDLGITNYNIDNQSPAIQYTPPLFYQGSLGPFSLHAHVIDISGIIDTYLTYKVDGIIQSQSVTGILLSGDTYHYTIPEQEYGANVDFWLTAIDSSVFQNISVTDTFQFIQGNQIIYDDSNPEYYTKAGPGSPSPQFDAYAVRFTVPQSAPNIVSALIRNYTDVNNPNDAMLIHVWDVNAEGGVGNELITPFLVVPEATLTNVDPFTRIDLRPFATQLSNHPGDVYVGFTVPSGTVNFLEDYPPTENRSFRRNETWYLANYDNCFRLITGPNHNDLAVIALLSPQSGFDLNTHDTVTVRIRNAGYFPQSNFLVAFSVNGSTPQIDTVFATINPGDSLDYSFATTIDLFTIGSYLIDSYTMLPGDQNPGNDHLITTVNHEQEMYCDILNYDGANYTGIGISGGGTFTVGVRHTASALSPYTGAHISQVKIYFKQLPTSCILKIWDAGTQTMHGNEMFSMDITDSIWAGWNIFDIQSPISISGTDLWVGYVLTNSSGIYPAGVDGGPPNPDGSRLWFSNGSTSTTIGNWNIRTTICNPTDSIDMGVSEIIAPLSSSVLGPTMPVTVTVRNFGTTARSGIPISFTLNGGMPYHDTIMATIDAGSSLDYTFSATADLSAVGDYTFDIYTSYPGDINHFNDHFNTVITHIEFIDCDTLHYDGPHAVNMGLSNGGIVRVATRFQSNNVNNVVGGNIEKVLVYFKDLPTSCVLNIWAQGGNTGPGTLLFSQNVTSQLVYNSWNTFTLISPIPIDASGFWVGVEFNHTAGKNPMGCDGGSPNTNGSWWKLGNDPWSHPPSYAIFGNWNIRAVVCPAEFAGATIGGSISYANTNHTLIDNAGVYLIRNDSILMQTTADAQGHYIFTDVPLGNYYVTAQTTHSWGGSNAVDALTVLRHFVGLSFLSDIHLKAADVNDDGNVNSMDALSIARRFVGLINSFPAGDWVFEAIPVVISAPVQINKDIQGICNGDVDGSYVP